MDARAGRAKRGIVIEAWPDLPAKNITSHDLSGTHTHLDPDYAPSHHGNAAVQVAGKDYH